MLDTGIACIRGPAYFRAASEVLAAMPVVSITSGKAGGSCIECAHVRGVGQMGVIWVSQSLRKSCVPHMSSISCDQTSVTTEGHRMPCTLPACSIHAPMNTCFAFLDVMAPARRYPKRKTFSRRCLHHRTLLVIIIIVIIIRLPVLGAHQASSTVARKRYISWLGACSAAVARPASQTSPWESAGVGTGNFLLEVDRVSPGGGPKSASTSAWNLAPEYALKCRRRTRSW